MPHQLRTSTTNPHGPFAMLNAMRELGPGSTHTVMLTFAPGQGEVVSKKLCL